MSKCSIPKGKSSTKSVNEVSKCQSARYQRESVDKKCQQGVKVSKCSIPKGKSLTKSVNKMSKCSVPRQNRRLKVSMKCQSVKVLDVIGKVLTKNIDKVSKSFGFEHFDTLIP